MWDVFTSLFQFGQLIGFVVFCVDEAAILKHGFALDQAIDSGGDFKLRECAGTRGCVVGSSNVGEGVFLDVAGCLEVISLLLPSFLTAGEGTIFVGSCSDYGTVLAHIVTVSLLVDVLPLLFTGILLACFAAVLVVHGADVFWLDDESYVVFSAIIVLGLSAVVAVPACSVLVGEFNNGWLRAHIFTLF